MVLLQPICEKVKENNAMNMLLPSQNVVINADQISPKSLYVILQLQPITDL